MGLPAGVESPEELVTRERMVVILYNLWIERRKMTTAEIARLVGIRWESAYDTMLLIERLTPGMRKDRDGWSFDRDGAPPW